MELCQRPRRHHRQERLVRRGRRLQRPRPRPSPRSGPAQTPPPTAPSNPARFPFPTQSAAPPLRRRTDARQCQQHAGVQLRMLRLAEHRDQLRHRPGRIRPDLLRRRRRQVRGRRILQQLVQQRHRLRSHLDDRLDRLAATELSSATIAFFSAAATFTGPGFNCFSAATAARDTRGPNARRPPPARRPSLPTCRRSFPARRPHDIA